MCPSLQKLVLLHCCDDDPTVEEWYKALKDSGVELVFERCTREDGNNIPFNFLWNYLDDDLNLRS